MESRRACVTHGGGRASLTTRALGATSTSVPTSYEDLDPDLDLVLDVDLAKCLRREPGAISGDLTGT